MLDHNYLKTLIKDKKIEEINKIFNNYNVNTMADIVSEMSFSDILFLLKLLPKNKGGSLFANFSPQLKNKLITVFSDQDVSEVFNKFYSDDIVDLLGELPSNLTKKILQQASDSTRKDINTILNYQEKTAGSIMTVEFVELKASDTIKVALEKVKAQGRIAEVVTECYVVDKNRVLLGRIALTDLIFKDSNQLVKDNMETNIITVASQASQDVVLDLMQKYDLAVAPVVNPDYCLMGIITVDDILDVMEDKVTKDVHQMAAISSVEESYVNSSVWDMAKARTPWLMILMFTALFTELVLKGFEAELAQVTILSAFIPMAMGTAGNAANQSSVMVIRSIVTDGLSFKDTGKIFYKEIKISMYLSITMFIITALRLYVFPPNIAVDIILSISVSIVLSIFLANTVGGLLPILAVYFKQDPAAMAAPIVTNIMDVSSLTLFFLVAKVILRI